MSHGKKINGVPFLLSTTLDGITYCLDIEYNIYSYNKANDSFTPITDTELINKILDSLEAKPLDIIY